MFDNRNIKGRRLIWLSTFLQNFSPHCAFIVWWPSTQSGLSSREAPCARRQKTPIRAPVFLRLCVTSTGNRLFADFRFIRFVDIRLSFRTVYGLLLERKAKLFVSFLAQGIAQRNSRGGTWDKEGKGGREWRLWRRLNDDAKKNYVRLFGT